MKINLPSGKGDDIQATTYSEDSSKRVVITKTEDRKGYSIALHCNRFPGMPTVFRGLSKKGVIDEANEYLN